MKKTMIVTGASGNAGTACIKKFIAEGYHIIAIAGKRKPDNTTSVEYHSCDLAEENAVNELWKTIITKHQTINAALFIAGGFSAGDLNNTTGDALEKMINLNFKTTYFLSRLVFGKMLQQRDGGKIILFSSKTGVDPSSGGFAVAYTLSKAMIVSLAELFNGQGKSKGIHTTVIAPGTIDTPENRRDMPDADQSKWVTPEALADAIGFLLTDNASAIHTSVLKIYGGQ